MTRLYTTDTKALNHILVNSYIYQKPEATRYHLTRTVGPGTHVTSTPSAYCHLTLGVGVLVVEEDKHRQQVRKSSTDNY